MERFVGKIAVVTGASSGIGEGIAKELLKNGINVVGLGRNITAPLQDVAEEVSKDKSTYSGKFYGIQCDITKETEVRNTFRKIIIELGPIWILVNNAGGDIQIMLQEITAEAFDKAFMPYTAGMLFCSQEAMKCMADNSIEGGHIVNIVSTTDRVADIDHPDVRLIIAAKTTQRILAEGLRREVTKRKLKIKISNIDPGSVLTESNKPYLHGLSPMDVLEVQTIARVCVSLLDTPLNAVITETTLVPTYDYYIGV